jgi:hypothetical protein
VAAEGEGEGTASVGAEEHGAGERGRRRPAAISAASTSMAGRQNELSSMNSC